MQLFIIACVTHIYRAMDTNEVIKLVDTHLQEVDSSTPDLINRVTEIKKYIDFQLRWAELSDEEKRDFTYCMEGFPLTEEQRKVIDDSNEDKKNHYFEMWSRSTYMKRCAWMTYLHGEADEKPFVEVLANCG